MNRSRVVSFSLLLILVPPLTCFAQSRYPVGVRPASPTDSSHDVISVRELQIPEKARKACIRGTELLAAKDSAGSISDFQQAVKIFPNYYEAYGKLGAAELDLEQWAAAESAFRKSIELSAGRYAPAKFGLGVILSTVTKQFAEAAEIVRSGLETAPTNVSGHFVMAWVLYSTSRLPEAEKSAERAISLDSQALGARLLLAQIHFQERKFAAVVDDLDAYLALGVIGSRDANIRALRSQALRALQRDGAGSELAEASR
jgi:tetratricopeptide (TPR) repeat protein